MHTKSKQQYCSVWVRTVAPTQNGNYGVILEHPDTKQRIAIFFEYPALSGYDIVITTLNKTTMAEYKATHDHIIVSREMLFNILAFYIRYGSIPNDTINRVKREWEEMWESITREPDRFLTHMNEVNRTHMNLAAAKGKTVK